MKLDLGFCEPLEFGLVCSTCSDGFQSVYMQPVEIMRYRLHKTSLEIQWRAESVEEPPGPWNHGEGDVKSHIFQCSITLRSTWCLKGISVANRIHWSFHITQPLNPAHKKKSWAAGGKKEKSKNRDNKSPQDIFEVLIQTLLCRFLVFLSYLF